MATALIRKPAYALHLVTAAVLGLIGLLSPVLAESAGETMAAFGLTGMWSEDCAANPQVAPGLFHRFTVLNGDLPTLTQGYEEYKIDEAARVTEEKIKISSERKSGQRTDWVFEKGVIVPFEKANNKIRIVYLQHHPDPPAVVNGIQTNGRGPWVWERCLNR